MSLQASVDDILETDIPAAFERFGRLLDLEWIDNALEETGTASVRRRRITAHHVVWLVIAMAMFRDRSIAEVVSHLGLVLPSQKGKGAAAGKTIAPTIGVKVVAAFSSRLRCPLVKDRSQVLLTHFRHLMNQRRVAVAL